MTCPGVGTIQDLLARYMTCLLHRRTMNNTVWLNKQTNKSTPWARMPTCFALGKIHAPMHASKCEKTLRAIRRSPASSEHSIMTTSTMQSQRNQDEETCANNNCESCLRPFSNRQRPPTLSSRSASHIICDAKLMWQQHPTHGNDVAAASDQWRLR